jgi:hypothetical protein
MSRPGVRDIWPWLGCAGPRVRIPPPHQTCPRQGPRRAAAVPLLSVAATVAGVAVNWGGRSDSREACDEGLSTR